MIQATSSKPVTQKAKITSQGAMGTDPTVGISGTNREELRKQFLADLAKLKKLDPASKEYAALKGTIENNGKTLKYKPDAITNYITRYTKTPSGTTPPPPPPPPDLGAKFPQMTSEQQDKTLVGQGGQPYLNLVQYGDNFDPNNPYAHYETAFTQARNRAYKDVMDQFNATMKDQFDTQKAQFDQRMTEQGIDPASATYQAQYKALADSQNRARQEAMSAASTKSYEVQNQAYSQAAAAVNQLTEMAKVGLVPWQQVQEARAQMERQQAVITGEAARTTATTTSAEKIAKALEAKATANPAGTGIQGQYAQGLLQSAVGSGKLI